MSHPNRALRGILMLTMAAWLGSCDTTTVVAEEVQDSPVPGRLSASLLFASEIAPDSASWNLSSSGGSLALAQGALDSVQRRPVTLDVQYGNAKGDSLWVVFRRFGLRVSSMAWVRSGADGVFTLRTETNRRDTLSRLILRKMHAAGLTGKVKADSLYANLLLDGKVEFDGFPDSVPGGMDPVKIRRLALTQAVARKIPLSESADQWLLGLSLAQARDSVKALVSDGLVKASDTSGLYPLARIRLATALSIDSALWSGGTARHLKGHLICEDGIHLVQVRLADDKGLDASASFAPLVLRTLSGTEVSLDSSGILLQAMPSTAAGTYRLLLTVLDRKPRLDTFALSFQVLATKIAKAPRISWVSPDKEIVQTTKDSTWLAKVKVDDSLGIDSVVIGGHRALKVGDAWQVLDTLHAWGSPVSLVARAYNAGGRDTSVSSPRITLNAPTGDVLPQVVALDPADGSDTVPFATNTRKVSWSFVAGGLFNDVQAVQDLGDGSPKALTVTKKDTVWSTEVPLLPNGLPSLVKVLVVTPSGYIVPVDTFRIARKKDSIAPLVTAVAPPLTVSFDSLAVNLRWKITDNHKMDTVKINGVRVVPQTIGTEIVYAVSLKLDTGLNKARVWARDSTGNTSRDSVSVIRLHSSDAPKIVRRAGTLDRTVEYRSVDSIAVAWTVTDKEMLDSVVIAGVAVKDSAASGIFTRKVPIGPGPNRIGIQAWGKFSNKSAVDTVEVTTVASDADLNKYVIRLMPDGRVWMTTNLKVSGGSCGIWGCDLSGRLYTWAQAMGLDTATYNHQAKGYAATSSVRGICPSGWHVATSREWSALYAATMPSGATDSAIALRVDTGWGGVQGKNLWGDFLRANFSFPDVKMSIGPNGIVIPIVTFYPRSMLWSPSEVDATTAEITNSDKGGTSKGSAAKTNTFGVRCIEDKRLIIRPIGVIPDGTLISKPLPIKGTLTTTVQ